MLSSLNVVECEGAVAVTLSPNGDRVCIARSGNNGAAVVQTSSVLNCELEGTRGCGVEAVVWADDGLRVACAGRAPQPQQPLAGASVPGFVCVSEVQKGARAWSVQRDAPVVCVAFSRDEKGERLACSRLDGYVEVLDAYKGETLQLVRLRGFGERWSHRTPFAGISADRPLAARDGALVATPRAAAPGDDSGKPCLGVAWSARGDWLGVARGDGVDIVDLALVAASPALGAPRAAGAAGGAGDDAADDVHAVLRTIRLPCGSTATSVALSSSSYSALQGALSRPRALVALCGGKRVVLADAETGVVVSDRSLEELAVPWAAATSVMFCPQPKHVPAGQAPAPSRLVVGGELVGGAGAVALVDGANGHILAVQRARSAVLDVSVSADGRAVAVGERRSTPALQAQHAAHQLQAQAAHQAAQALALAQGGQARPAAAATGAAAASNFVAAEQPPPPPEAKAPSILDHVMDLHRNKVKKLLEDDVFADRDAAAVARVRGKMDDLFAKHHEMVQQLFAAERAVGDWKQNGYLLEPQP